jgi:sphinganine-1-phosphate aldolase
MGMVYLDPAWPFHTHLWYKGTLTDTPLEKEALSLMGIPKKGMDGEGILQRLESFRKGDLDWRSGRVFGYVFDPGEEIMNVGKAAYSAFLTENGLDFTAFPSLLRLENELAGMLSEHLGGDDEAVGNFTSGGTESIMLAVKAARDFRRERSPEVRAPEILLPETAHAAFHKAAHYLDVDVVQVPVDAETFRADVDRVRDAITPNTILLVGSAPSYAHGVVDPIRELGELALERGLLLHVDACMGGFMLPYFRRLGEPVPDFDLSVPGVTSLSVDLHKYAYTPKGASLILYRDRGLRKHQIYACARWSGYSVVNNAVQSSKSGGPMAAAWAVLHYVGDEGYLEIARRKLEATKRIAEAVEAMDDLRLLGRPDMCLVAFTSDTVDVFRVVDEMAKRGWYVQPAFAFGVSPRHVHLSVNASNTAWVEPLLEDLRASVAAAREAGPAVLPGGLLETLSGLDPSGLDDEAFGRILEAAGMTGGGLPEEMAGVNGAMNALPPALRERLLTAFVNDLFRPER